MKKYMDFLHLVNHLAIHVVPPGAGGEGLDLDVSQMQVHVCACADCKYRDLDEILAQVQ